MEKRADVLEEFEANVGKFEKLLAECDEKTLGAEWTLRHGDHIILREPRAIALRTFGLSHMVHHCAAQGILAASRYSGAGHLRSLGRRGSPMN